MRRSGLIAVSGGIAFFGACDRPVTTPDAGTVPSLALDRSEADVPARNDPWRSMSTADMWAYIARHDSSVTLGIKAPGKRRGVYNGRWHVAPSVWNNARATARNVEGVSLLQVDGFLPAVRLKVSSPAVLDHIRGLPFVDYVEPVVLDGLADEPPSGRPSLHSSGASPSILSPTEPRFSSISGGDDNYGYYIGPTGD